jgi:C1A family cysteine protease
MFRPRTDGHITPDGEPVGGHAYRIVQAQERRSGGHTQRRFRVVNSWSRNWGQNGRCWIDYDSMGELLAQDGEVVVPTLFAA